MPSRPVIGIPTQTLHAIEGISSELPPSWVMSQRYFQAATAVGGVPWMIPLVDDPTTLREIYDRLDGVFLPGGVDIDPINFGEEKRAECGVDRPRRATASSCAGAVGGRGQEAGARRCAAACR